MAPAGYPQQQMMQQQQPQPYPAPYPQQYPAAPQPYYAPPAGPKFNIGIIVAIGLIIAAVGLMIVGGSYFMQTNIKTNDEYKTALNLLGAGWVLAGIGVILVALVEFIKAMKKA